MDEVTSDPDYFKNKYFKHEKQEGKIIKNIHQN